MKRGGQGGAPVVAYFIPPFVKSPHSEPIVLLLNDDDRFRLFEHLLVVEYAYEDKRVSV